jgi:hypothetical protein
VEALSKFVEEELAKAKLIVEQAHTHTHTSARAPRRML